MTNPTEVEKMAKSLRGYGNTWENWYIDIANDFYRFATMLEAQAAEIERLRKALKQALLRRSMSHLMRAEIEAALATPEGEG